MDSSSTPCLSFIGIVDFSQEARWIYMTDSVTDLLGYEPSELRGRPSLELVHPDEAARVRQLHYETIKQDKAAVLVYLRMKHKNPMKGYILCGISRTVVHNVLIGSVSFATSGAKALHNASTAQEITVISPAPELEFRRWHDPSPMPPSFIPLALQKVPPLDANPRSPLSTLSVSFPVLSHTSSVQRSPSPTDSDRSLGTPVPNSRPSTQTPSPPPSSRTLPSNPTRVASLLTDPSPSGISFPTPPSQSSRTALILNRFSRHCTVMYCSNDHLIYAPGRTNVWEQRSFFDFVATKDEDRVKSWIDVVKSWGVNERGQPSDGGFGFCKFGLISGGRSSIRSPQQRDRILRDHREQEPRPRAHRNPHSNSGARRHSHAKHPNHGAKETTHTHANEDVIEVDAIFSAHSDGLMVILRRAT
ncbi:hypothetical protein L218DRAFT_973331 [Marasmius fiardii PR-910]|nr:hypothetical protein L218DRAFT_973331 [Marasmius fiardii PR-910]